MSKLIIALTTMTVASAGASTYFWKELSAAREQTASLQARLSELEQAREAFTSRVPDSEPIVGQVQTTETRAAPDAAKPAPATRPTFTAGQVGMFTAMAGPGRPGSADPDMRRRMLESHEQQVRMLQDPEYRELMRAQHKYAMQQQYSDLETMLGLTKEESERLLDVLAEQSLRSMEERPMLPNFDGTPPTEAEIQERRRAFEEQRRKNEAEIAAVLGPKYNEWEQYQQAGWARSQVAQLRQSLAVTDEPLRPDQVKPLVDAIAREQKQVLSTRMTPTTSNDPMARVRMAEEWLERTAQSHERIRAAVSGLLTPAQYQQLERQQQQELKMQELSVRQQRARAEAQARGELPPDPVIPGIVNSAVLYTP